MNIIIIITIMFGHWLSDFVLQNNKQKPNRDRKLSKKIRNLVKYLLPHTLIYSLILTIFVLILQLFKLFVVFSIIKLILFFIITYITHFITDFCVTMINVNYLKKNKRHKYFVSIGLDQFLHYVVLFITILLLFF